MELRWIKKKSEQFWNDQSQKTVKEVQSFLRLASFYQRFIKDYVKVARSLYDPKKENPFCWEEAQQVVFDTLKLHFTTVPILAFPDIDCVFYLESDTSNYATEAVLSIEKEGVWYPVAFSSHSMIPQEQNYLIADWATLSPFTDSFNLVSGHVV